VIDVIVSSSRMAGKGLVCRGTDRANRPPRPAARIASRVARRSSDSISYNATKGPSSLTGGKSTGGHDAVDRHDLGYVHRVVPGVVLAEALLVPRAGLDVDHSARDIDSEKVSVRLLSVA
jgi:hypothetical protein